MKAYPQRGISKGGSREAQVRFPTSKRGQSIAVKVDVVQMEKVNYQMGHGIRVFEEMTF